MLKDENHKRIAESVEAAGVMTEGLVGVIREDKTEELFSKKLACLHCNLSYPEIQPRIFSFNSPYGACPECTGLGVKMEFDPDLIIPDKSLSFNEGAIATLAPRSSWARNTFDAFAKHFNISADEAISSIPEDIYKELLYGTDDELDFVHNQADGKGRWEYKSKYEGVVKNLERRHRETKSEDMREWMQEFMKAISCVACGGKRLRKESLAVKIMDHSIIDVTEMTVE